MNLILVFKYAIGILPKKTDKDHFDKLPYIEIYMKILLRLDNF